MRDERPVRRMPDWLPPRALAVPLLVAFAGGVGLSLQSFANGHLSTTLGSSELAGSVNNVVGLVALGLIGVATGVPRRAVEHLRKGRRLRWWHLLVGVNGALYILVTTRAAPLVGIALLTVALVFGQSVGSLVVDRIGLSPAGKRSFTRTRVLGVALALVAVMIGALGSRGDQRPGLLALAAIAGAGIALQQAAIGHVAEATGEPLAGGVANLIVGGALMVVIALVVTGGSAPHGWSAPAAEWTGGVFAAIFSVIIATTVPILGVLRLMLAVVAGQSVGALVLDLVAPAPGEAVSAQTVVSVVLTFAAVAVSGLGATAPSPSRRPAPG
jgi:transporter family-2 protein